MRTLNKTELAEAFQVSRNTVSAWVISGCPLVQRGKHGREALFDLSEVMQWRKERQLKAVQPWEREEFTVYIAEDLKNVRKRARAIEKRTARDTE